MYEAIKNKITEIIKTQVCYSYITWRMIITYVIHKSITKEGYSCHATLFLDLRFSQQML
jgi:hypothetical protein